MAIDGDVVAVGAFEEEPSGLTDTGAVYAFRYNGAEWIEEAKLVASDAANSDNLGYSVTVYGDVIVAGAYLEDPDGISSAGSAYVFRYDGAQWVEEAKLTASDPTGSAFFGYSVSLSGDWMAIGAYQDDPGGISSAGSVYMFHFDGAQWVEVTKLVASDGASTDRFGKALSLKSELLVVGAEARNSNGVSDSGAAYVFRLDGANWNQEAVLISPLPKSTGNFGASVAASTDRIVVGADMEDQVFVDDGAAYVFRRIGAEWILEAKLTAPDFSTDDELGGAVAIEGNTILVGAVGGDTPETGIGSVYLFRHDGLEWLFDQELPLLYATSTTYIGVSVDLSNQRAIVGSYHDISTSFDVGAAFVLNVPTADCNSNTIPDECEIASSESNDEDFDGILDDCDVLDFVPRQVAKLTASDAGYSDYFGNAVAMQGDWALVGALSHTSDSGVERGRAYFFEHIDGEWIEQEQLFPADDSEVDSFGTAVDLDGTLALVGAPEYGAGRAFVFRHDGSGWVEEAMLAPSDGGFDDYFGLTVALSNDIAVVGAPYHDLGFDDDGAVYVYRHNSGQWTQETKLLPSDQTDYDTFGYSVDLDANRMLVGSPEAYAEGFVHSGAAYVFEYAAGQWVEAAKLYVTGGDSGDDFGSAVALRGDVALISADGAEVDGDDLRGAAYLYRYDGVEWKQESMLIPEASDAVSYFGDCVALSCDLAVVGANLASLEGMYQGGAAYFYSYDGSQWLYEASSVSKDMDEQDYFGTSVALEGDRALIGATGEGSVYTNSGAAYVFDLQRPDCNANDLPDACDLESGASTDADGDRVPDECLVPPSCEGDANGDGAVDPLDSGYVQARFGCVVGVGDPACDAADVNLDGAVDPLDSGYVLARFGGCD